MGGGCVVNTSCVVLTIVVLLTLIKHTWDVCVFWGLVGDRPYKGQRGVSQDPAGTAGTTLV